MANSAPKKKPQGASRNAAKAPASKKPAPGWLWMLLGIVMASFVAFLLHLWGGKPAKPKPEEAASTAISAPADDSAAEAEAAPAEKSDGKLQAANPNGGNAPVQEPRFDFYTLLPNQKVMPNKATTEASTNAANQAAAQAAAQASKQATTEAPATEKPAPTLQEDKTPYFLQAGSFKSEGEADHRRANILMQGLPVKVVPIRIKQGEEWFRVVVGPFKGKEALQSARASLKANGVDTMVLKQG